jgi:hypothetical protein
MDVKLLWHNVMFMRKNKRHRKKGAENHNQKAIQNFQLGDVSTNPFFGA